MNNYLPFYCENCGRGDTVTKEPHIDLVLCPDCRALFNADMQNLIDNYKKCKEQKGGN